MKLSKYIDHTLLKANATKEQIVKLCNEAKTYDFRTVCVNPSYIPLCVEELKGSDVGVCTVIGFPLGMMTTEAKVFEAKDAIEKGALEVDMVLNIGRLKDRDEAYVTNEIKAIKEACGEHILKVIIETCLLTDEEKIKMCEIVTEAGADFIKTSTGFSTAGATFADVELFAKYVGPEVKIKAAGGISSMDDAKKFIELGATRLGTSRIVKIVKNEAGSGY